MSDPQSAVEAALLALLAALTTKATSDNNATLPTPTRNEQLVTQLLEGGDGLRRYLNVIDGDRADSEELLEPICPTWKATI